MSLAIRAATPADMGFVHHAWRASFFEASLAVRGADREHYRAEMERVVARLCKSGEVRVACDPKDADTVVAFAAFTRRGDVAELHYIYVKKDFRGHGIARDLLRDVKVTSYTFKTPAVRPPKGWAFTPRFTIS